MGTNFYWIRGKQHIGKRSAAGRYCYDCKHTLCVEGEQAIHYGKSNWYASCPTCGQTPKTDGHNSSLVELGFAQSPTTQLRGVQSAASFSWAVDPTEARARCQRGKNRIIIQDEYGFRYTGGDFLTMLASGCPIEFTDSIGVQFS